VIEPAGLYVNQFNSEVMDLVPQLGAETFYDKDSTSRWMVYSLSQWVSYDDADSFADKTSFLMSRCLRGFAVWSLDLDTQDYQALTALVGEDAMVHALVEDQLNPDERRHLVGDLAAYTGQNCYVTQICTDGSSNNPESICVHGYMSVATGHYPLQIPFEMGSAVAQCDEGKWHHVCCPTEALPQNCEWSGAPERSEFGCDSGCGDGQFELTRDSFVDDKGEGSCYSGARSVSKRWMGPLESD